MAIFLDVEDLEPFVSIERTKAETMVEDVQALAVLAAPCLGDEARVFTDNERAAIRAILRGAVIYWHESGSGALQSQQVGPFGQMFDTRQPRRGLLRPSDITQLQAICKGDETGRNTFALDTVPTSSAIVHADICALYFGAAYCSCGAVLTRNLPLYEGG